MSVIETVINTKMKKIHNEFLYMLGISIMTISSVCIILSILKFLNYKYMFPFFIFLGVGIFAFEYSSRLKKVTLKNRYTKIGKFNFPKNIENALTPMTKNEVLKYCTVNKHKCIGILQKFGNWYPLHEIDYQYRSEHAYGKFILYLHEEVED